MIAVIAGGRDVERDALVELAEAFSPRVEWGASGVAFDASGLTRLFGSAEGLAREIARQAEAHELQVHVGIAATRTAATLAAIAAGQMNSRSAVVRAGSGPEPGALSPDPFVVPPGTEAAALALLPLSALASIEDLIGPALEKAAAGAPARSRRRGQGRHYRLAPGPQLTHSPVHQITRSLDRLHRWGLRTLGDLAALPAADLSARLGEAGLVLQRAARGEDERPLVPDAPAPSFLQSFALEWPVDDLQPLAFIVARLCEGLEAQLARADRGAIAVMTSLRLVTKDVHLRRLTLPAPMRDARVLRTLVMLDLESHPPGAAVDEVAIDVDVAPGRIVQAGLFAPALPAPEALSTLVARLGALMGESRVGAPALVDTHHPGAFEVKPFAPHQASHHRPQTTGPVARESRRPSVVEGDPGLSSVACGLWPAVIRRFRPPRPARVIVRDARPVKVAAADVSGAIATVAGPWRSSGGWWDSPWDRDEWDATLETGVACRLALDRATGKWVVDGLLD